MLAEKHEAEMMTVEDEKEMLKTILQSRDKAEADFTVMKEKFNQKCIEANELRFQLKACRKQLTQAILVVVDECARRDDLEKAHSDLESRFSKVSTSF
jgi:hypothetical protein